MGGGAAEGGYGGELIIGVTSADTGGEGLDFYVYTQS